jgi:hypothetical protein
MDEAALEAFTQAAKGTFVLVDHGHLMARPSK